MRSHNVLRCAIPLRGHNANAGYAIPSITMGVGLLCRLLTSV
ncbi:hypothetical protein [Shewanella xiamenensis]|nr:hypothetical protein [Shewanella xiamenensis]MEE1982851.1 hypothetical protein [Shewanella xiamenensis]